MYNMASWSHFLSRENNSLQEEKPKTCFRTIASLPESSSVALVSPTDFAEPTILRSLSDDSSPVMSENHPSEVSVGCHPADSSPEDNHQVAGSSRIPRRNLMEAFEELHIKPLKESDARSLKSLSEEAGESSKKPMVSPTGVIELNTDLSQTVSDSVSNPSTIITPEKTETKLTLPSFNLHHELKKDLSDALVSRVSFYAVIHDINKEATSMAANDDSGYSRNPEDMQEEYDPLIVAVNGPPKVPSYKSNSMFKVALIDEERWLLDAIDSRSNEQARSVNACPPTFLQAMGEKDYENPLTSLSNGSRTQLWKPSRSWWEAKSGKNPWIEPKSHNKRWRYLWPLIHYHKFLAKCIKKLKRNGVDVKTSVSPVSVFLREEVCAISDHLAAVSLFDSDEWMSCLTHFNGWMSSDEEEESHLRSLVASLKLRPLTEPGEIDSPLLRSQIDDNYLRAMVAARAQMAGIVTPGDRQSGVKSRTKVREDSSKKTFEGMQQRIHFQGQPPVYSRQSSASPNTRPPLYMNGPSPAAGHGQPWSYHTHPGRWWGNQFNGHGTYFGDDGMNGHSAMTGDNFPQHFDMSPFGGSLHSQYYPPMMYPQHHLTPSQPQTPYDPLLQNTYSNADWIHPQMGHIPHSSVEAPNMPGTPSAPIIPSDGHAFNSQVDPNISPSTHSHQVPVSPYWGHLDHTTLAMMGIASPQGALSPQTPSKGITSTPEEMKAQQHEISAFSANGQPLLLRQQYYGYGVPPSPATQFMMSPQNVAYNYTFGQSPHSSSPSDPRSDLSEKKNDTNTVTPTRDESNNEA